MTMRVLSLLVLLSFSLLSEGMLTIPLARSSVSKQKRAETLTALRMRQELYSWADPTSHTPSVPSSTHEVPSLLQTRDIPLKEEILSEKHLATYYGNIGIGDKGAEFRVLFDTGSCEFWVPGAECSTERCKKHHRLPLDVPRKIASKWPLDIKYLSGKVQGDMIYANVHLGDIKVSDQVVGLGKNVDIELLDDVVWDGILGLAYPNAVLSQRGVKPVFDTIIESNVLTNRKLYNQFAYYIDDRKGAVTFGGANCDLIAKDQPKSECVRKFTFVPVSEKTYWTIRIKDVSIKTASGEVKRGFCPSGDCKAIVDTGTYLVYGPGNEVNRMMTTSLSRCSNYKDLPEVTFHLDGGNGKEVPITIRPIDYVLKFENNDRKECVVGISPDKDTIWTLGQVFLRSFYTIFDRDQNRVGFAPIHRTKFSPITNRHANSLFLQMKSKIFKSSSAPLPEASEDDLDDF